MKKLPLGMQTFREIIEGGYVYVDKTRFVYELLNEAKYYFLSRPRRFGKSLLLDTIAEAFSGDRELFNGLWIHGSDYAFEKHPVLRFDMSNISNETPEILKKALMFELTNRAKKEDFTFGCDAPPELFKYLIEALHKKYGKKVVVLIDEYDKPILDHILDVETAEANRAVIRSFYGVLKSMDPHLRMTLITGVSKFTKTSIFSELNNLYDITMSEKYANICGIPVELLGEHFSEHIESLKDIAPFNRIDSVHDKILEWYDGYSWNGIDRVINPFGLLSFFAGRRLSSFWYASGSPKFLINLIKANPETYSNFGEFSMAEWDLDIFDVNDIQPAALLFQTGYLTVKEIQYTMDTPTYLLQIPNLEVREAFNLHILSEFTEKGPSAASSAYRQLYTALREGSPERMLETLRWLCASIPYQLQIRREAYYHSILLAVMSVLGFNIEAEVSTARGRIDAVLELDDKVYVMEFKYKDCDRDADDGTKRALFDEALEDGMRQLIERGYAGKYAGTGKTVIQAAFAFLGRDDIEMRLF